MYGYIRTIRVQFNCMQESLHVVPSKDRNSTICIPDRNKTGVCYSVCNNGNISDTDSVTVTRVSLGFISCTRVEKRGKKEYYIRTYKLQYIILI